MPNTQFNVVQFIERYRNSVLGEKAPQQILAVDEVDTARVILSLRTQPLSKRRLRKRFGLSVWVSTSFDVTVTWDGESGALFLEGALSIPRMPKTPQEALALYAQVVKFNLEVRAAKFYLVPGTNVIGCSMPFFGVRNNEDVRVCREFARALDLFCKECQVCASILLPEYQKPGHA